MELKWLDADEFAHWSSAGDFDRARAPRKAREWDVYTALAEGRGDEVPGLERIVAPPGVHVIDHVADQLAAAGRAAARPAAAVVGPRGCLTSPEPVRAFLDQGGEQLVLATSGHAGPRPTR